MEVLSSRFLLRPNDLGASRRFYRDVLGLAVYREFGPADDPGVVFFLGQGFLEVSGHSDGPVGSDGPDGPGAPGGASGSGGSGGSGGSFGHGPGIWLQVRDVDAEHDRLVAGGVTVVRPPKLEPWGLVEMWIEDPDGTPIVLVEIPPDHPLRRDQR
ncbi:VOC family protein [Planotetraspora sp. GP83]|uniref:VOC family protein n=1 Tax=Planotetraspora sp. GP83 TaxID=3156264 RepID=UPI0035147788